MAKTASIIGGFMKFRGSLTRARTRISQRTMGTSQSSMDSNDSQEKIDVTPAPQCGSKKKPPE